MVLLGRTGRGGGVQEALQAAAGGGPAIVTMMRSDAAAAEDASHAQTCRVRFPINVSVVVCQACRKTYSSQPDRQS